MRWQLSFLPFLLWAPAIAREVSPEGPPRPASPAEVRQTVAAVVGDWAGLVTVTVPETRPESFPWRMSCREVASGRACPCTMEGTASIGPIAQACLVAYAVEDRAVHYMCATSMGEVHDHRGDWRDERTIEFRPLAGALLGQPMTETVTWFFPGRDSLLTRSVISMDDGRVLEFEFRGRRE